MPRIASPKKKRIARDTKLQLSAVAEEGSDHIRVGKIGEEIVTFMWFKILRTTLRYYSIYYSDDLTTVKLPMLSKAS